MSDHMLRSVDRSIVGSHFNATTIQYGKLPVDRSIVGSHFNATTIQYGKLPTQRHMQ